MDFSNQVVDDFINLYASIGYVALKWSYTEQATDMACSIVFHQCGGKTTVEKRLPKFTRDKNKFLVKAIEKLPELSGFAPQVNDVTGRIAKLMDIRHDFIHSVLTDLKHSSAGVFKFQRLDTSELIHRGKEWKFDVKDFPKLSVQLEALAKDSLKLTRALVERFCK